MWLRATLVGAGVILAASVSLAFAEDASAPSLQLDALGPITLGKVLTFLLVSLGPFNVVGPFIDMTRGRDAAFKRQLAIQGTFIAALVLLVAATVGVRTLRDWSVSPAALLITIGILLFRVGLQIMTMQMKPRELDAEARVEVKVPKASALAFAPLAFPTIATPYGIAALTLAMTLASEGTLRAWQILIVAGVVLSVDLLAMLVAESMLKLRIVAAAFGIVGAVMAVLQIALSVQAVIAGLRLLGILAVRNSIGSSSL